MNILKRIKCEKFIPPKFTWGVDHPDYISPKKRKKQNELITRNPEISKESTYLPRKKKQKTRNNVSVTIECITKLDRESVKKLQSQRETLLAQGIADRYPIQNSISTKLYDTVALFLLLNKTIDTVYDMENEVE